MDDFKLKLILSLLVGVIFSFVFILLSFALPLDNKKVFKKTPKNTLEKVSHSVKQ
ncbi:hypothetical protein [Sulfurimonas sp.]|uniref:hypothetical protein n=1 Tax=Sulfurimonas sp. TaxID=2022749 RepID=UPI002B45CA23|nr:hypothetical protein [Sulfurimonas sp.]